MSLRPVRSTKQVPGQSAMVVTRNSVFFKKIKKRKKENVVGNLTACGYPNTPEDK